MRALRNICRGAVLPCRDMSPARLFRPGFTLIELLVVVAIIALLLAILLPSLSAAREQAKSARCLANLRSIGQATQSYAVEDPQDLVVPVHQQMVQSSPFWEWRTVIWFVWGGRSGQQPFQMSEGDAILLADDGTRVDARPQYAARTRPLTRYMLGTVDEAADDRLEWFHCPSDRGYPDHQDIDDSPRANAGRSCYETLGNSYRASLAMVTTPGGVSDSAGHFAYGPWGHRLTTLRDTGRLILMGEPAFFNMIGRDNTPDPTPDPVVVTGWHKRRMMANLLFCDGSARATNAFRHDLNPTTIQDMNVYDPAFIARGNSWRLDCYPTPGARIFGSNEMWRSGQFADVYDTMWPFANRQENLLP